MIKVGIDEYPLVEYLAGQLMLSDDDRFEALHEYFPDAKEEDWRLWQAGQRVQIIKRDPDKGGVLKLGTEIVAPRTAASPPCWAPRRAPRPPRRSCSTCWRRSSPKNVATPEWQAKIRADRSELRHEAERRPRRVAQEWAYTSEHLQLPAPPRIDMAAIKPVPASSTVLNSSDTPVPAPVHDLAP